MGGGGGVYILGVRWCMGEGVSCEWVIKGWCETWCCMVANLGLKVDLS